MTETWESQEIHLTNFIFGEARLFRLPLPEGWTLRRGFSHPELHATHWRQGVNWVASAYLHYLLESANGMHLLEFTIRVGPHAFRVARDGPSLHVGGHPASLERRRIRRGPPWRRREAWRWRLVWSCPQTERHFLLELVGRAPEEVMQDLVEAWQRLICH